MIDKIYLEIMQQILDEGDVIKNDRTGVGTRRLTNGIQLKHDHRKSFPLIQTKKIFLSSVISELLWFLYGKFTSEYLDEWKNSIWEEWITAESSETPLYGYHWRSWMCAPFGPKIGRTWTYTKGTHPETDQISTLMKNLRADPYSRRHLVTAWNPLLTDKAALPACHPLWQIFINPDSNGEPRYLDLHHYQRSGDYFIGIPFNIASYGILMHLIAHELNLIPRYQTITIGDAHIYENLIEQAKEQISRKEKEEEITTLEINGQLDISNMLIDQKPIAPSMFYLKNEKMISLSKTIKEEAHFVFKNYHPLPHIKAEIAR